MEFLKILVKELNISLVPFCRGAFDVTLLIGALVSMILLTQHRHLTCADGTTERCD